MQHFLPRMKLTDGVKCEIVVENLSYMDQVFYTETSDKNHVVETLELPIVFSNYI